jgi:hypothetical protein
MKKVCLVRDLTTPHGVMSGSLISTDVRNAAARWCAMDPSREIGAVHEEPCVSIELNWQTHDSLAPDQFNSICIDFGLKTINCMKEKTNGN